MHPLQEAANALQSGNVAAAYAQLKAVLKASPRNASALQLMGIAQHRLGNRDEAVKFLQKSLQVNDAQPQTHHNLAMVLAEMNQDELAIRHYGRAIALAPDLVDAGYNMGLLLSRHGRWREACICLETVTQRQPGHGQAFEALGIALRETGDGAAALVAAARGAGLQPNSHTAHHNLGQALLSAGDFQAAAGAYQRSLSLNPRSDVTWIGLGHACRGMGRAGDARSAYQHAVDLSPGNPDAHRLLNEMLWQTGDIAAYLQSFPVALRSRIDDHGLRLAFANELLKISRHEEAVAELSIILGSGAVNGPVFDAMARAKSAGADFDTAAQFHARALEAAPGEPVILRNYAETLLRAGHHGKAHDVTVLGRQRFPLEQGVLALHTTAQRLVGDEDCRRIADYAGIARVMRVEPPAGYADIETFCAQLKPFLETLHATRAHPTDQTLRGGTQTFGALFQNPEKILQQFVVQLRKSVSGFIAAMPEDASHPLFARARRDFDFAGSWSVRLSSGGFHTNHFHPMGWISSAFYVDVPEVVAVQGKHDGWLKMGETNLELGGHEVIERLIQPRVGELALFPSYFWHGTVPFQGSSPRITIAFDVVPK